MKVIIITVVGQRREIGRYGEQIWSVPGNLERTKDMTKGHPVIVGRKAYDSLAESAQLLADQLCIVLSHHDVKDEKQNKNIYGACDVQEALSVAKQSEGGQECYVLGGAEIYRQFLPYCDVLELTEIEAIDQNADARFPRWERSDFREVSRESCEADGLTYHHIRYEKK